MIKPKAGSVEITTRCNAACIMCPHTLNSVKGQDMEPSSVLYAVRQEVAMGCTTILAHHLGEPTLHPEYTKILTAIRDEHPTVYLKVFTNGSRLTNPTIRNAIAECSDFTVVSIDGTSPEAMEKTRPGLKGQKVIDGLRALMKENRRGDVVARGVLVPGVNEQDMAAYEHYWRAQGVDTAVPVLDVRARERVFPNPCSRLYTQIDVRIDGTVGICCRDPGGQYTLGNAFDKGGIAAAWYGEKARKFRRDHRAGKIDLCNNCTWDKTYAGNPAALE